MVMRYFQVYIVIEVFMHTSFIKLFSKFLIGFQALQSYVPKKFCRCLRLRGQPVNVREQQDFFKVFSHTWLIALTNIFSEISVKNFFKTPLLVAFFATKWFAKNVHKALLRKRENIPCSQSHNEKSQSVSLILEQFVRGELLEEDNAYCCEECDHHVLYTTLS
jgi:hypothetical protein